MKDTRIQRIEQMLASGNDAHIVYAALECRFAIEHIVQKKLKTYEGRHGTKLLHEHWQPTKALKVLCQLEPMADQSHTLSMSKQDENGNPTTWVSVGNHEALTSKWISKHYHKLGSYLHMSSSSCDQEATVAYLRTVLAELKRVDSGNLNSTFAHLINFECQECSATISCNAKAIATLKRVVCPNDTCVAEYIPHECNTGEWELVIDKVAFKCLTCERQNSFYASELSIGFSFPCTGCQQKHVIESRPWGYRAIGS